MIIVLEGMDRLGKTTQANAIKERLNFETFRLKYGRIQKVEPAIKAAGFNINGFMEDCILMEFMLQTHYRGNLIIDRTITSSVAYDRMMYGVDVDPSIVDWWFSELQLLDSTNPVMWFNFTTNQSGTYTKLLEIHKPDLLKTYLNAGHLEQTRFQHTFTEHAWRARKMGVEMKQVTYEDWHGKPDELTDRMVSAIETYAYLRGHMLK